MKNFILPLLFLYLPCFAQESLIAYPTYEDFKNKKGIIYEGSYEHVSSVSLLNLRVHFKNKDESVPEEKRKIVLKGEELWGFSSNGRLYRCYWRNTSAYVAFHNEEFVIYVHSQDQDLPYVNTKFGTDTLYGPYNVYISKDFSSPILSIDGKRKSKRFLRKLKETFPDEKLFKNLSNCIGSHKDYKEKLRCLGFVHD